MLISVGGPSVRRASAGQTTPPPAPQSASLAPASTFADALDARLRELAGAAQDVQQKTWLAQLTSFYVARRGAPVWISDKGWTERGRQALAELENAESYGLDQPALRIPVLPAAPMSQAQKVAAEIDLSRAIIAYAYQARGGRIDPQSLSLWLDRTPDEVYATAVMIDMIAAADAGAALRAMHPQSEAFQMLRAAYASMREEAAHPRSLPASDVMSVPGPTLKIGDWHPDVAIVRRRLDAPGRSGFETKFDEALAGVIDDKLSDAGVRVRWGRIDDKVRAFLNLPPPPPSKTDIMQVQANMERWRWLPRDLGDLHIWNNLPEFLTRVVKDGKVIHEERIIVGQPATQTPVFTNYMRQVVFQPEWGVPPSIKINDLLPKLQAGDLDVLERRNMRILGLKGREIDPERFNWDKVDIRDVGIYQRSGDDNPLGRVKFLFPNKHHVYMHDTNNRALFKEGERTFSHGCVRVRNPERLAEIILGNDKGWDRDRVQALLRDESKANNKIELERPFPVHNVYFTLVPGPDHTLVKLDDIYGHDERVARALSGTPSAEIAEDDPARNQLEELEEAAPPTHKTSARASDDD